MKICSINPSWPTMARAISAFNASKKRRALCIRSSISVTASMMPSKCWSNEITEQWSTDTPSQHSNTPTLHYSDALLFLLIVYGSYSFLPLTRPQRHEIVFDRLLKRLWYALGVELGFCLPPITRDDFVLGHFALSR